MSGRQAIATSAAPAAIGPYSQAIRAGDTLYLSGQIALDPRTGALIGEDAATQARQALDNLEAVLAAAGATPASLVQCSIYLIDLNDFEAVNRIYAQRMPSPPPARVTVEVRRLPRDAKVEIGAVAWLGAAD